MKAYATFRRHPFGEVVAHTNADRHPLEVVPYGRLGGGGWTGHPIELVVVLGILLVGLIGIPAWPWFFGATLLVGGLVGYFLSRRDRALYQEAPVVSLPRLTRSRDGITAASGGLPPREK